MATPTPPTSAVTSLRLPTGTRDQVVEAAAADGESFNGWIVRAVEMRLHPSASIALKTLALAGADDLVDLADAEPLRFVDRPLLAQIAATLTAAGKRWPKR